MDPRFTAVDVELSHSQTLDDVLGVLRIAARDLTGADGVTVVLREGDLCFYAEENAIGPLWKGRRFPIKDCVSGWAMLRRQIIIIPNIYDDPRVPLSAYGPTFVKALALVPLLTDNPLGAIGAYWSVPHAATPGEIDALVKLASLASTVLERVLADGAQRRQAMRVAEDS